MSNEFKAAAYTALFTFIATASTALLGFLGAVENWINGTDPNLMDDLTALSQVILSAVIAAASGLFNYVIRKAQAKGVIPGQVPVYPTHFPAEDATPTPMPAAE